MLKREFQYEKGQLARRLVKNASAIIQWEFDQDMKRVDGQDYYNVEPFAQWVLRKLVHGYLRVALFLDWDRATDQMAEECWWG